MGRHTIGTVLLGWTLVTAGWAAASPVPGTDALKWANSLRLPLVTVQEKVFPAATKRANFTFFDGAKDVRVENGVLKFTLAADKAVLGWGNFMGKQPLSDIQDMCDEINEVTLRVRQSAAASSWSKQVWVDGMRVGPATLDTRPLTGTEWTELKFASSTQSGGATVPTPDGLEFAIEGTAGNQVEIEWLKLTEAMHAGYVRREFTLPAGPVWRAIAEVGACPRDRWSGANKMEHLLYINGKEVKRRGVWYPGASPVDIAAYLKPGKNCVGFYGYWREDPMVFFQTRIVMRSGEMVPVQTDTSWKYSAEAAPGWNRAGFDDGRWSAAQPGVAPTGDPSVMSDQGLVWMKNPAGRDFFYRDDANVRVEVRLPAGLKAKTPGVECMLSKADADGRLLPVATERMTAGFTEKDGSLVYAFDLGKRARGVYAIASLARSAQDVIGERTPEPMVVVRKLHQKQIEGRDWFEGLDVELEDTIDFTNPADPHPWIEAVHPEKADQPAIAVKTPTVVTANGLTYREAPWYFSYRFQFKAPGSFYLMELEYPDDARRIIDVGVASKFNEVWTNDQSGVGAETGGRYALTGKMQTLRWIHVADAGPHSIDVFAALPGMTAAARSLKVYRIKGDLPAVPAGSDRVFGIHTERCYDTSGIGMNFGVGGNKTVAQQAAEAKIYSGLELRVRHLQFLQDASERYTQYLKFAGQNSHIMGVFQYEEGNTPFLDPFEYDTARIIPSMKTVLANTLDVNDITFYLGVEWSEFIRAGTIANNAQVARGADTIWMVDAAGKQLYGNALFTIVSNWMHPENREQFADLIRELGDKFGHLSHFAGFHYITGLAQRDSYYPPALTMPNDLANPYLYSYDDSTFRQFEQETGIRLGIPADDPQRFARRAAAIRDPRVLNRYRDWRGEKLRQFLSGGFTDLRRERGNLQFLNMLEVSDPKFYKFCLSTGRDLPDLLKDYALDIDRLNRVKGMTLGWQTDSFRIWLESFAQNPYEWLPRVDPYFVSVYDRGDVRYVLARTSWDENAIVTPGYTFQRASAKLAASDWIMDYTRTRTLPKPAGVHCREALMQAIIAADVNVLMSGFTDVNISVGSEQEIRELMTVFTHLPREKFATVLNTGFETNLAIRKLTKAGKTYFYAANPGYWGIQGNIVLTAGAPVLDLVSGKPVAAGKKDGKIILPVALKGYDMAAYRVDSPSVTVESFSTGAIAPEEQAHMDKIIARVDALINDPKIVPALAPDDRAFMAGIVRKAREALNAREYARAWATVTNTRFWAFWQDFLEKAVEGLAFLPPEIAKDPGKKDLSEPRVMEARPAGGAIRLDGRLDEPGWSREKFQTGFVDKNGQMELAETGVKVLCDDQALYLGIICADKDIKALKASDAFSWADDAIAIFIQPDETVPVYYQLGFNAKGDRFHQKVTGGVKDYSVLPGWKPVVAVDGTYWTAEVMLPYATFGMKDKGAGRWRVNVHRLFRDGLIEAGSWSFATGNWHDVKRLGRLQFP